MVPRAPVLSDDGSMSTITCPGCGFEFETSAVTNTRCRRCRKVVNIGRTRRTQSTNPADDEYEDAPSGAGWVVAALGVAVALGYWFWHRGSYLRSGWLGAL
jgi:hypothetical protein